MLVERKTEFKRFNDRRAPKRDACKLDATKFEIFDVKRIQRDVNVDDNKVVIRIARLLLKRPLLPTLALQVQSTPFTHVHPNSLEFD